LVQRTHTMLRTIWYYFVWNVIDLYEIGEFLAAICHEWAWRAAPIGLRQNPGCIAEGSRNRGTRAVRSAGGQALRAAPKRRAQEGVAGLQRHAQHLFVFLRGCDARIGLVAVVGQRAGDDLTELLTLNTHGRQPGRQAQPRIHVADRIGDVAA
jgi:hypothetical protein